MRRLKNVKICIEEKILTLLIFFGNIISHLVRTEWICRKNSISESMKFDSGEIRRRMLEIVLF